MSVRRDQSRYEYGQKERRREKTVYGTTEDRTSLYEQYEQYESYGRKKIRPEKTADWKRDGNGKDGRLENRQKETRMEHTVPYGQSKHGREGKRDEKGKHGGKETKPKRQPSSLPRSRSNRNALRSE
uniref:Uncharacterized protein n=1 Tax=Pseudo-nitzschia australis TaxID=44445 RepID=A0A7S4ENR7_9STRA